jgi:hypothetical protein
VLVRRKAATQWNNHELDAVPGFNTRSPWWWGQWDVHFHQTTRRNTPENGDLQDPLEDEPVLFVAPTSGKKLANSDPLLLAAEWNKVSVALVPPHRSTSESSRINCGRQCHLHRNKLECRCKEQPMWSFILYPGRRHFAAQPCVINPLKPEARLNKTQKDVIRIEMVFPNVFSASS